MSLPIQPYKGARDFYPSDKRLQEYIFGIWQKSAESFGYEPYDAPALELTEIYESKTSDEIVNEQTYSFVDRGERNVTLRTEMTPSVSRMVAARRQELGYPLRLYSIPRLWRYERPQRGRTREFWQLNVDIFGVEGLQADVEILRVVADIMKRFGAKPAMYEIKINSRKFVDYVLLEYLGLNETQASSIRTLVDKMPKMDPGLFVAELEALFSPSERDNGDPQKLMDVLSASSIADLPEQLRTHESLQDAQTMLQQLEDLGISNASFDIALMRGFDYYTDIVFEVFDTNPDNNRSMFGGGRYDGLVGQFGAEPVATVGFGMGDVTIQNFLEVNDLLPRDSARTKVYVVVPDGGESVAQTAASALREMSVTVAVDLSGRKIEKQLKTAEKLAVDWVLFAGEKEAESGQYDLKNMRTGETNAMSIQRVATTVLDARRT